MTLTLTDRVYFCEQFSYVTHLAWIHGLTDMAKFNFLVISENSKT